MKLRKRIETRNSIKATFLTYVHDYSGQQEVVYIKAMRDSKGIYGYWLRQFIRPSRNSYFREIKNSSYIGSGIVEALNSLSCGMRIRS